MQMQMEFRVLGAALWAVVSLTGCNLGHGTGSTARSQDSPLAAKRSDLRDHPDHSATSWGYPSYAGGKIRAATTPEDGFFEIVTYNFNHVWAGNGYASRLNGKCGFGCYRAKLSVKGRDGKVVAEIFFIDRACYRPNGIHKNPESVSIPPRGYFFLYFPADALPAVQLTLAQKGTSKTLAYYDHEWAIESVGDVSSGN